MGEEAEDVLTFTNISDDEKESYKAVPAANFNNYFKVHKMSFLRGLYLTAETNSKGISRTIHS